MHWEMRDRLLKLERLPLSRGRIKHGTNNVESCPVKYFPGARSERQFNPVDLGIGQGSWWIHFNVPILILILVLKWTDIDNSAGTEFFGIQHQFGEFRINGRAASDVSW